MTAPAITYPPAETRYFCDHSWPVTRPCEPGILADCAGCGLQFAACTATPLDVMSVMAKAWRCVACEGGQPCQP